MHAQRSIREDTELASLVLTEFYLRKEFSLCKELIFSDLLTKMHLARIEVREACLRKIVQNQNPKQWNTVMGNSPIPVREPKRKVDIAIVTVIKEERLAAKLAFDIDPKAPESHRSNGIRFFEASIINASREKVSIVITMVGKARNVPMASAMSTILNTYEVQTCILVGIAAGLKEKVQLGDVVPAYDMILDYEGRRLESDGAKRRPQPYRLQQSIRRDLENFDPLDHKWHQDFNTCLKKLETIKALPKFDADWIPKYVPGVVLAGEALLADGRLPEMRTELHEQVRAAEMEGSGFASICDEYSVPWLVFRGISDYGDRDKNSIWQHTAALAAATCARKFIEVDYRSFQKTDFNGF